jgi:hypothetical protein
MIIHNSTKIIKTTENFIGCLNISIPSDQCIESSQVMYTQDAYVNTVAAPVPLKDSERMRFLDTVWQVGKIKDHEFMLIDISALSSTAKEEWTHKITMKNARTQGWFQAIYIKY